MHNYVLIEHNYSQFVIYNLNSELNFWKYYNVGKIFIVMIVISGIIMK
jgi:cytochrome b subunit of formate dehydrogenase